MADARDTTDLSALRAQLASVVDPLEFLAALFSNAPVGFQIYKSDGHSLLTNAAFRRLFGSEPPPEYNVLHDEIAERTGVLELIRRAFRGETIATPPIWYDARELKHVTVREARRVGMAATFFPLFDREGQITHVGIVFQDVTEELRARERSDFLARASQALAESLDYRQTLRKVAELAVPAVADWCTITIADDQGVARRLVVIHKDPAKAELARAYEQKFPPAEHRSGIHGEVKARTQSVLLPHVDRATVVGAAQDEEHLALMEGLGVASCILVPIRVGDATAGVISLMRSSPEHPYDAADLALAEELSSRAGLAVENARLYSREKRARELSESALGRLAVERRELRQLFLDAPVAIAVLRGDALVYELANPHYLKLVGRTEDELLGKPGRLALPELVSQGVWDLCDRAFETGVPFVGTEFPAQLARRTDRGVEAGYFNFSALPFRDVSGTVDGIYVFAIEVTDQVLARKRAEELATVRANEQRWVEAVLDKMPTPMVLVAPRSAAVRFANQAAHEAAGGKFPELNTPDDYPRLFDMRGRDGLPLPLSDRPAVRVAQGEPVRGFDAELRTPAGIRSIVVDTAVVEPMAGHDLTGVVAFHDVTRLKQIEGELQQAVKAREEFLNVASHELKTPLTSLQLQLDLLRSRVPDSERGRLDMIDRQSRRLSVLVNGLLDVARISGGRLELDFEQVDLASVVRDVVAQLGENAQQAGCELRVHAPGPVDGEWDPLRVEQVVTNLLSNAIKYGGGKPIDLRVVEAGDRAVVSVTDQGIGIAPEDVTRIFQRFERAVSHRNFAGLGLGLYISAKIVDGLGGKIAVESQLGRGATFTVELPRRRGKA